MCRGQGGRIRDTKGRHSSRNRHPLPKNSCLSNIDAIVSPLAVEGNQMFRLGGINRKGGTVKVKGSRVALALILSLSATPSSWVSAALEPPKLDLDIAVLVDESRSLSPKDVAAERSAVVQIVSNPVLFDSDIRISIVPFSSGDQSPRELPGCTSVQLTGDTSEILAKCAGQIVRQTRKSSSNTDFATAISRTSSQLLKPEASNRFHAIVLLTDGQYDPDGDEITSSDEKQSLENALESARAGMVAIWALGFGNANLKALQGYSDAGAQVPSECVKGPKSSKVSVTELDMQMGQLVASLTCTPAPDPQPTPNSFSVNPLLNRMFLSVTSRSKPSVIDAAGHDPCSELWTQKESRYECILELDGSNAGEWTIRTDTPGVVDHQLLGDLSGSIESCDANPILRVNRTDGLPINWDDVGEWPLLNGYFLDGAGVTLAPPMVVRIDRPAIPLTIPAGIKERAARLEIELPRDSKDSLVYSLSRVSCDLGQLPVASSTTSTGDTTLTSSTTVTTVPETRTIDEPPNHLWIWVVSFLLIGGACLLAFRIRRNRLFPDGTLVMQESLDKPGTFVELDGEVAGKRRVSLRKSGGRFLSLEPYGDAADITLSRSGLEVQVEYPTGEISEDGEAVVERTTAPFGIALKVQGFVIRVDIPEGIDEEF